MADGMKMAGNAGDFAVFSAREQCSDYMSAKTILSSITDLIYTAVAIVFRRARSGHAADQHSLSSWRMYDAV